MSLKHVDCFELKSFQGCMARRILLLLSSDKNRNPHAVAEECDRISPKSLLRKSGSLFSFVDRQVRLLSTIDLRTLGMSCVPQEIRE